MLSFVDNIKDKVAENFGGIAQKLTTNPFSLSETPSLTGKVAVVTGGSQGIGYGVTHTLLEHDIAKLFILSTSEDVVKEAKKAVAEEMGQKAADKTIWIQCDLTDWDHIRTVADEIKKQTDRLDILVNNAGRGIMTYQVSEYGVDRHMALNHFGHYILTAELLPLIKKTAEKSQGTDKVRIVNLASNMHRSIPSDVAFASVEELNTDLGPEKQYGRSKLADILHARYFERKVTKGGNPNIVMNATHPGVVSTQMSKKDIFEPYPRAGYAMAVGLEPFKKDQFEGALSTVYAATLAEEGGQYINPPATVEAGSAKAQDEALADQLMKLTREVLKQKMKNTSGLEMY